MIYRSNSEKFSHVPRLALKIVLALGFALSTLPAQTSQAAVESSELTLTAQNFHIYTSGNLRFVLGINSQSLIDEFLNDATAVFRISLGQKITEGEKQVR
ncbi:MAG: hypothetical protein ACO28U_08165, partial [Ilumatobacteraceae bacterium]